MAPPIAELINRGESVYQDVPKVGTKFVVSEAGTRSPFFQQLGEGWHVKAGDIFVYLGYERLDRIDNGEHHKTQVWLERQTADGTKVSGGFLVPTDQDLFAKIILPKPLDSVGVTE